MSNTVKVVELREATSFEGLSALGVDTLNDESVQIPLTFVKTATDNAQAAADTANTAATSATNAAESAGAAATAAGEATDAAIAATDKVTNAIIVERFSVDGATDWHDNYDDGDLYFQRSNNNGQTWTGAIPLNRAAIPQADATNLGAIDPSPRLAILRWDPSLRPG